MAFWVKSAFDYLAMGNYPYPTGYILFDGGGTVTLPAWPLRAACSHLSDPKLEVKVETRTHFHRCYERGSRT